MDEHTQLKDSILAQAHEKGRKLVEEAKESVLKEETVQEERLIQDKLNQRSEQLKRIQRQVQFVEAVLDHYQGQAVILIFGAVSAAKFGPADLEHLRQAHQDLTVSEATIPAQAGFVLSVGKIDDNYLYRDLVDSIWEQESYQMAASIFTDEAN